MLISPDGNIYKQTSPKDGIEYSQTEDEKSGFWALLTPKAGNWKITIQNPQKHDSIITGFRLKPQAFKFTMTQKDNKVTIHWDVAQVSAGQKVNVMLDDNHDGFDGLLIAQSDASNGSLSFTLDETTPDCQYHLFAQLTDNENIVIAETYADKAINNILASLAPPANFEVAYNEDSGHYDFTWEQSPNTNIIGYILTVTDAQQHDSVYAVVPSHSTSISLLAENGEGKTAKIESYNVDWQIGCPSSSIDLTTAIEENTMDKHPENVLFIYPNPTKERITIRYYSAVSSRCSIKIYDITGRLVATPLDKEQYAGSHRLEFDFGNLPEGIYLVRYSNGQTNDVKKVIFCP